MPFRASSLRDRRRSRSVRLATFIPPFLGIRPPSSWRWPGLPLSVLALWKPPNGTVQTSYMQFFPPISFPLCSVPEGFGTALRDARKARGWTQARLAEAAGIKRETVAQLEAQRLLPPAATRRRPAADTVFRLQAALDLMPGELVEAWPEWSPIGSSSRGARSRARRRELGLSLTEVASAAGISAATLSRFERDIRWETKSLLDAGPGAAPTSAAEALARALRFSDAKAHANWCKLD